MKGKWFHLTPYWTNRKSHYESIFCKLPNRKTGICQRICLFSPHKYFIYASLFLTFESFNSTCESNRYVMNRNIVACCSINSQGLKINFGIYQSMSLLWNEIDCYFALFHFWISNRNILKIWSFYSLCWLNRVHTIEKKLLT